MKLLRFNSAYEGRTHEYVNVEHIACFSANGPDRTNIYVSVAGVVRVAHPVEEVANAVVRITGCDYGVIGAKPLKERDDE